MDKKGSFLKLSGSRFAYCFSMIDRPRISLVALIFYLLSILSQSAAAKVPVGYCSVIAYPQLIGAYKKISLRNGTPYSDTSGLIGREIILKYRGHLTNDPSELQGTLVEIGPGFYKVRTSPETILFIFADKVDSLEVKIFASKGSEEDFNRKYSQWEEIPINPFGVPNQNQLSNGDRIAVLSIEGEYSGFSHLQEVVGILKESPYLAEDSHDSSPAYVLRLDNGTWIRINDRDSLVKRVRRLSQ